MNGEKTMARHAVEGFLITVVGDSLYKVLGIATTFVVLAVLSPYEYGIWKLLQSALSFMSIFALSGITGVVVADISRELGIGEKAKAHAATWRAIQILMTAGIVAAVCLFVAAPFISAISKIHLTAYLWILAVSLIFGGVIQVLQILFQARLEPRRALLLKNIANTAYLAAIILCIPYLKLSVMGMAIAYVVSTAVPVLFFLPYIVKELGSVIRGRDGSYSLSEVLIRRGGWALATDYVSILESSLWPWIVGYFLSIEEVAYTGLAIVIVSQVYSIIPLQYILRGILPRLVSDGSRMEEWIARAGRYSMWLHIAASVAVLAALAFVMPYFFPKYAIATPLVAVLLIAAPFRAVGAVIIEWLYAVRNQRAIFLSTAIPRLVCLLLLPLLLIAFGIAGFAIWYLLSSISIILVRFALTDRRIRGKFTLGGLFVPDDEDWTLLKKGMGIVKTRLKLG